MADTTDERRQKEIAAVKRRIQRLTEAEKDEARRQLERLERKMDDLERRSREPSPL